MNAIINIQDFVQVKNSQTITTSELIAQAFNKRHDNVLQSIDNLLADIDPAFAAQNFRETETSTQNNLGFTVKNRAYELTKDGFMLLVMGFTGKAALAIKIAYIQAFNKMAEMLSGSLKPKLAQTTVADRTPLRQAVSALVGKCNIDYSSAYSMVHQRFGVDSIEEIAADKLPDAIAYIHALTLHSGLVGEVLEKQPAPAAPVLDDALLLAFARLLLHAQDMRLFVNRYLPAFQNLGIDGRGALWSFVHDTEPTFAAVRRFMTAQSVKSDFFARDWDWVRSRILSTARAF